MYNIMLMQNICQASRAVEMYMKSTLPKSEKSVELYKTITRMLVLTMEERGGIQPEPVI